MGQQGMPSSQNGMPMNQQGVWPGLFPPRGYPMQYSQPSMAMGAFNGWGMPPMMGGNFGGGFTNPYGMPFGMMGPHMDPMMAWYALHYGQYAHAMNQANANAANARRQAQEEEGAAIAAANEADKAMDSEDPQARQNLRWWQDPEKVCLTALCLTPLDHQSIRMSCISDLALNTGMATSDAFARISSWTDSSQDRAIWVFAKELLFCKPGWHHSFAHLLRTFLPQCLKRYCAAQHCKLLIVSAICAQDGTIKFHCIIC